MIKLLFITIMLFYSGNIDALPLDGSYIKPNANNNNIDDYGGFEPLQILCEINGFNIPAIIDTGAQITVMSSSCAKRCRVSNNIDCKYAGRAIGVGSSEIIGRIDSLPMRIGPISFNGKVSVLNNARVDLLIGIDFLRRFQCDICLTEGILKLRVKEKIVRIPLMTARSIDSVIDTYNYDGINHDEESEDDVCNDQSEFDESCDDINNDITGEISESNIKPLSVYNFKSNSRHKYNNDDDNDDQNDVHNIHEDSLSLAGV